MTEVGEAWSLDDAVARHAEAPDSFFIPPVEKRSNLQVGDVVKLLFRLEDPADGDERVERMWVEIEGAKDGEYTGVLTNTPRTKHTLGPGSPVTFGAKHVAALAYDRESLGYAPDQRIFVSREVLEGGKPPRVLYLGEALDAADSGWQALSGEEADRYAEDPANVKSISIGWFIEKHPEIEAPIKADRRGEWTWNSESEQFEHPG